MVIDKTSEEFKEKKRQISREWYEKNKERKSKYMEEYFKDEKNKKRNTQRYDNWRKEHRKEYNKRQRDYMRKKLGIKPENYYREKIDESECPVCRDGWNNYKGNYDDLCNKHYLEIEPTSNKGK